MQTNIVQHMSILESMAQLNEEWIVPIKASIKLFERYHEQMLEQSAFLLTRLVYDSIHFVEKIAFENEREELEAKEKVPDRYKDKLRELETNTQEQIELTWNHVHMKKEQHTLPFENMDLFSKETASIFGLTQKELIITGATSGAITGAGIDLLFAGHTLLLGGAIGAIVGGAGAYFGFNELSEVKVLGQTLGKRYVQMGPMENRNFPYILLGRGLYHTSKVATQSHASRDVVDIDMNSTFKEKWLTDEVKKSLEEFHKKFRSGNEVEAKELKSYTAMILHILKQLIDA
jgi:hypothetical protein